MVFQVALPLLAVQLTRSPLLIAGVTVAARIPWLVAPVAGAGSWRSSWWPNTFVGPPLGGLLVGTWLAVPAERRLGRVRTLVVSVVLSGASLLVPAVTVSAVLVGASQVVSGVAMVLWNVVTVSLRQRITPDRLLGRMNASYRLVGWGTMPLGALLGGALAELLGLRATFLIAAVVVFVTLAGFGYVTEAAIARAEAAGAPTG